MKASEIVIGGEYAIGGRGSYSERRRGVVESRLPSGRFVVLLDPRYERCNPDRREIGANLFHGPWADELVRRRAAAAMRAEADRSRARTDVLCARLGLWLEARGVRGGARRTGSEKAEVSLLALAALVEALGLPELPPDHGPLCGHQLCRDLAAERADGSSGCEFASAARAEVSE